MIYKALIGKFFLFRNNSNLVDILNEAKDGIERINIGFTDLASSMKKDVNNPIVMHQANIAKNHCKLLGKRFSFGGSISPENIRARLAFLQPDCFETRLLVLKANITNPHLVVAKALEFEKMFEGLLIKMEEMEIASRQRRIVSIEKRLGEIALAA